MAVVGGHTNPSCGLVKHHIQEQQTPIFSEAVNSANRLRKNRSLPFRSEPGPNDPQPIQLRPFTSFRSIEEVAIGRVGRLSERTVECSEKLLRSRLPFNPDSLRRDLDEYIHQFLRPRQYLRPSTNNGAY